MLLRADTRVTTFSLTDGAVTAQQAVLQAGTAVLVDERGLPRLRCASGSPLPPRHGTPRRPTAPATRGRASISAAVVMTPVREHLAASSAWSSPPVDDLPQARGSLGPQDIDQIPETALLEGVYAYRATRWRASTSRPAATRPSILAITVELRNCSRTLCMMSAPKNYWSGEFPFTAVEGRWQGTGPTGWRWPRSCKARSTRRRPSQLTLTPGDFAVATDGMWRVNSLTGRVTAQQRRVRHLQSRAHSGPSTVKRTVRSERSLPRGRWGAGRAAGSTGRARSPSPRASPAGPAPAWSAGGQDEVVAALGQRLAAEVRRRDPAVDEHQHDAEHAASRCRSRTRRRCRRRVVSPQSGSGVGVRRLDERAEQQQAAEERAARPA